MGGLKRCHIPPDSCAGNFVKPGAAGAEPCGDHSGGHLDMVISMEFHGLSGGNQKGIDFPIRLGISSSQLMNSIIFQRGRYTTFYHQPVKGFNGLNREIFGFHLPVSSFFLGGNRFGKFEDYFSGARGANFSWSGLFNLGLVTVLNHPPTKKQLIQL